MKITKRFTHYWFVIVSILSFLTGWGMLAHSLKPVTSSQTTTVKNMVLPTLQPIEAFNSGSGTSNSTSNGLQMVAPSNNQSIFAPVLRTGGS
jgi:hypothetical protein